MAFNLFLINSHITCPISDELESALHDLHDSFASVVSPFLISLDIYIKLAFYLGKTPGWIGFMCMHAIAGTVGTLKTIISRH